MKLYFRLASTIPGLAAVLVAIFMLSLAAGDHEVSGHGNETAGHSELDTNSTSGNDVPSKTKEPTRQPIRNKGADTVPKYPLAFHPVVRHFLQSALGILAKEIEDVRIPSNAKTEAQVVGSALQQVDVLHILKRFLTRRDIRVTLPKPANVNQRCYDHVIDIIDGVIGQRVGATSQEFLTTNWAFRVLDAFGKPSAGFLRGTLHWVGDYDQCLDVHVIVANGTYLGSRPVPRTQTSDFYTKYCRVDLLVPPQQPPSPDKHGLWDSAASKPSHVHWGTCLPEVCSEDDVESLFSRGQGSKRDSFSVQYVTCFDRENNIEDDAGAIFAICLLSVIGAVLLFCTAVESAIHYGLLSLPVYTNTTLKEKAEKIPDELIVANGDIIKTNGLDVDPEKIKEYEKIQNGGTHTQGPDKTKTADHKTPLTTDNRPKDILQTTDHASTVTDASAPTEPTMAKKLIGQQLIEAFSMRANLAKLLSVAPPSGKHGGTLTSIQGLRVISMAWIVLGHTYVLGGGFNPRIFGFTALSDVPAVVSRFTFTVVGGANLGVDTFFCISGILVMMLTLRELRKYKGEGLGFWIKFYIHRLWRLTPVYMMVLMVGTTLYDHVVHGPLKAKPNLMFEYCSTKWWTNLLYVNNLVYHFKLCMPWMWYLAVDMQLFVVSPIFIILVHRKYRFGILALLATIVIGTVLTFGLTLKYPGTLLTMFTNNLDYWNYIYQAPWPRIAGFTVGLLTGVILEDKVEKPRFSRVKILFVWLSLSCVALFLIFIVHDQWKDGDIWPRGTQALYEALSRPIWSVFVAWIVYACHTGDGGIVNEILSWPGFQPLARLTYTVYLVHPLIITFFAYDLSHTVDLNDGNMIFRFSGNLFLSYLVATAFTLLFEAPLLSLEKILWKRK